MAATFERLSAAQGSVIFGWLGARVLYSRFDRAISTDIASKFARRLTTIVGDTVGILYFTDSSSVISYDLAAFASIVDAMRLERQQLKVIVARPWAGALDQADVFARTFGCAEYVTGAEDFYSRLHAAEPRAFDRLHELTTLLASGTSPATAAKGAAITNAVECSPEHLPNVGRFQFEDDSAPSSSQRSLPPRQGTPLQNPREAILSLEVRMAAVAGKAPSRVPGAVQSLVDWRKKVRARLESGTRRAAAKKGPAPPNLTLAPLPSPLHGAACPAR